LFKSKAPSIKDWFDVLNWPELPNLGNCHTTLGKDNFQKSYYITTEIQSLYENLTASLDNNVLNSSNVRILGRPGTGKTSFLYALKYMSEFPGSDSLTNCYFYIFHINKSDGLKGEDSYKDEINDHILLAWKGFFEANGYGDDYLRISSQKLPAKETMNLATAFYKSRKSDFKKVMIFAVDDVDLLPDSDVIGIVDHLLKSLEISSVKKWLSIRSVTLENYSRETKKRVDEFFPDPYDFPTVSLFDLVNYRIKNSFSNSSIPKLPFEKNLCEGTISPICEGNMREGLALLKTLLENVHPKGFKATVSEKVIQQYIAKSAVDTLCRSQKLQNLHSITFKNTSFPLAVDILACTRHHAHEPIIYGAVTECCTKRDFLSGNCVGEKGRIAMVRVADFNHVMQLLIDHEFITKGQKERFHITEKGKILSSFATRPHYYLFNRDNNKMVIDDEIYWDLAQHQISHNEIVNNFITVSTPLTS
jgi:hypothetical protein